MKTKLTFEEQRKVELYLQEELSKGYFKNFLQEIEKTDEIGHSHGPGVQKEVAKLLSNMFEVTFILDNKNNKKKRALADCLIDGVINSIKFGISKKGQPNLGSMKRIMSEVIEKNNNVMYVTWVHFDIETNEVKVWFINILDFCDCLTWNAGTGQMMIDKVKISKKYQEFISKKREETPSNEIKNCLMNLYEVGMEKHIKLKQKQLQKFANQMKKHI